MVSTSSANLPDESLPAMSSVTSTGVYYGFAQVFPPEESPLTEEDKMVHPMVMSLGWNPFFKNERLSAVRPTFSPCSLNETNIDAQGNSHYAQFRLGFL